MSQVPVLNSVILGIGIIANYWQMSNKYSFVLNLQVFVNFGFFQQQIILYQSLVLDENLQLEK
jgi:hypothetical protein